MTYLRNVLGELNTLKDRGALLAQLVATWRVGVAVVVLQAIGAACALLFKPFGDSFLCLWFGAALASLPGFILGRWWQNADETRASQNRLAIMLLYGLSSTAMTVIAWPMAAFQELVRSGVA